MASVCSTAETAPTNTYIRTLFSESIYVITHTRVTMTTVSNMTGAAYGAARICLFDQDSGNGVDPVLIQRIRQSALTVSISGPQLLHITGLSEDSLVWVLLDVTTGPLKKPLEGTSTPKVLTRTGQKSSHCVCSLTGTDCGCLRVYTGDQ